MESLICICGAGIMGRGIALAAAQQGISVILYDVNPGIFTSAEQDIEKELSLSLEKNRITLIEKKEIIKRIRFTGEITECRAPLIIEAIQEKIEAKSALFNQLAHLNPAETLFASNTSSLSITRIAEQTPFPERVFGLHFFNPANRMKLTEIVKTKYSRDPEIQRLRDFALQLKKTTVLCRDSPGFLVNRIARPFYLESLRLAEKKTAEPVMIDKLMESVGFPMGPFHLMDLIGHDINYAVSESVYEALGKPLRMKPSLQQEDLVKKGMLGKKTGIGFFQYHKPVSE
jgi:3-hydroxybutyryl-CoA dehydrogenase